LPARTRRSVSQSRPAAGDQAGGPAVGAQHLGHGTHRARGAVGHVPFGGREGVQRLVDLGLGRHLGGLEGGRGDLTLGEVAVGPGHAAQPVGLHAPGLVALAEDHFRRAAADVHHQPALVGLRQQARDALVDQPRFFLARDHLDGKTQDGLRLAQELFAVAGLAQGLRGHGAHLVFFEALQPLGKAGQAVPAALHGGGVEHLVLAQAGALADGFLDVFDALDMARVVAADFEAEAVGAEIDGGKQGSVLHGEKVTQGPRSGRR